jgi:hypothetical protein
MVILWVSFDVFWGGSCLSFPPRRKFSAALSRFRNRQSGFEDPLPSISGKPPLAPIVGDCNERCYHCSHSLTAKPRQTCVPNVLSYKSKRRETSISSFIHSVSFFLSARHLGRACAVLSMQATDIRRLRIEIPGRDRQCILSLNRQFQFILHWYVVPTEDFVWRRIDYQRHLPFFLAVYCVFQTGSRLLCANLLSSRGFLC